MTVDVWHWLNFGAGLLLPLLSALCALFCFLHRRLSSWLLFAVLGFLLECTGAVIDSSGFQLLQRLLQEATNSGAYLWVRRPLCDATAFALIFAGLTLTLRDISRRLKRLKQASNESPSRFLREGAPELSRSRKEDSHDIQQ